MDLSACSGDTTKTTVHHVQSGCRRGEFCSSFNAEFRPSREAAKCKPATIHYEEYDSFNFSFPVE